MKYSFQIRISLTILTLIIASLLLVEAAESYDPEVQQMQKKLKELGYDPGLPDGLWGEKTRAALKDFQADYGLPTTGKLDELTKKKLTITKPAGKLSLHKAVRTKNIIEIKALLTEGVDLNSRDKLGETPLHVAAVMGYEGISTLLIEGGADVNARDKRGLTPLHAAAWMGHQEIVSLLLASGAEINAKSESGVAPLHTAALTGREKTVSLLIANGADIDVKNNDGMTPLHVAAFEGHPETVAVLINSGADSQAKSKNGLTALDLAYQNGNQSIIDLLKRTENQR